MFDGDNKPERFVLHLNPLQGALEMFCRRGLFDASQVEDVLQEAIVRAYRDFGLFAEGSNFRAWIFKYLRFVVMEANRRFLEAKQRHGPSEGISAEDLADDTDYSPDQEKPLIEVLVESPEDILEGCEDDLRRAVLCLRPIDRSVFLLKAIGEFRYREIAEIVGLPLGTVMSSLSRARHQIRIALGTRGDAGTGQAARIDQPRES